MFFSSKIPAALWGVRALEVQLAPVVRVDYPCCVGSVVGTPAEVLPHTVFHIADTHKRGWRRVYNNPKRVFECVHGSGGYCDHCGEAPNITATKLLDNVLPR